MTDRSGAVLIIALVVLMMVSLAAYQFTISMESEHVATHNGNDLSVARHCALSGIELAAGVLNMPRAERPPWDQVLNTTVELWPTDSQLEERYLARIVPANRFGETTTWDESAKLNLWTLLTWDAQQPESARRALMNLPDMDESTADRLLDWIDSDSQVRPQGNETGAGNAVPLSVDQLAFLGLESMENVSAESESIDRTPAWLAYLTVHSVERNVTWDGSFRINLNGDDLGDLHRVLRERTSMPIANYVVWARQHGIQIPESADSDLVMDDTGPTSGSNPIDFSVPPNFEFESLADLINSFVNVPAATPESEAASPRLSTQKVRSPFTMEAGILRAGPTTGMSADELFDQFTLTAQKRIRGRINILTAPIEVLAGVPNLDEATAEQIVAQRENSSLSLRHPIGLLSSLTTDSTMVKEVLSYLTVTSDAIHVQVSGWIGQPENTSPVLTRPAYHCDVVLDASSGRGRPVLFHQLIGSHPIVRSALAGSEPGSASTIRPAPTNRSLDRSDSDRTNR